MTNILTVRTSFFANINGRELKDFGETPFSIEFDNPRAIMNNAGLGVSKAKSEIADAGKITIQIISGSNDDLFLLALRNNINFTSTFEEVNLLDSGDTTTKTYEAKSCHFDPLPASVVNVTNDEGQFIKEFVLISPKIELTTITN